MKSAHEHCTAGCSEHCTTLFHLLNKYLLEIVLQNRDQPILIVCQEGEVRQIWRILGKLDAGGNLLKQKKPQNSATVALGTELGCFNRTSHVMGRIQGCRPESVRGCHQ